MNINPKLGQSAPEAEKGLSAFLNEIQLPKGAFSVQQGVPYSAGRRIGRKEGAQAAITYFESLVDAEPHDVGDQYLEKMKAWAKS